jgi:formylglycine-generating enzyme required for sulfatase activity
VLRGGSWSYTLYGARCAARGRYDPASSGNLFGFRVVVSPGSP